MTAEIIIIAEYSLDCQELLTGKKLGSRCLEMCNALLGISITLMCTLAILTVALRKFIIQSFVISSTLKPKRRKRLLLSIRIRHLTCMHYTTSYDHFKVYILV